MIGNGNSNVFTANLSQRNLHNEFGPRYVSERPASALASNFFNNQQQQQGLSAVQRLNGNTSNSDLAHHQSDKYRHLHHYQYQYKMVNLMVDKLR
jgi:hypothetical protein